MDHSQADLPATSLSFAQEKDEAQSFPANRRPSLFTLIAVVIWLVVIVSALGLIVRFSNSPGRSHGIPVHWPVESRLMLDTTRPTLIMFAHPHCPCTRASLGELDVLMARCQGQLNAHVVFAKPPGTPTDWTDTDLWKKASAIPGVSLHSDDDGIESRRFHSETSGQTMLYDQKGNLLFQGGITISRGHSGDNPGRSALVDLLAGKLSNQIQTPVFGCCLFDDEVQQENTACKP